jgi:tetratricopeptide (TPR) repeat protein
MTIFKFMMPAALALALGLAGPAQAAEGALAQANALLEARNFEAAAQAYEKLGKQSSKTREAWRLNNWGLALLRLNKPAQAVELLEEAKNVDPKNFTARGNLGLAYERIGDKVKASDVYSRGLELLRAENKSLMAGKPDLDPDAAANVAASNDTPSAQAQEKASTLKGDELKSALKKASELLDGGQYQAASDAYAAIGQTSPAKREGWRLNNYGLCRLRLGDLAGARARLEQSVEVFPDNPVAWNNLGVAYESLGLHDKAKDAYAHAASSAGEEAYDPARAELSQLKLDFAAERRRWEALSR